MARMDPLSLEECSDPELRATFDHFVHTLGFVPNSLLTMQRVPAFAKAVVQMNRAVFSPAGKVDLGLKRLVAHMASFAAGCQYCKAHTTVSATRHGIDNEKMAAVYDYATSPLFSPAERAALDVAVAAGCVPNAVTEEMFLELRKHWSEEQIVEIVGVIAIFGFLNRWNDTLATPLEDEPTHFGETHLASQGWDVGKHARG